MNIKSPFARYVTISLVSKTNKSTNVARTASQKKLSVGLKEHRNSLQFLLTAVCTTKNNKVSFWEGNDAQTGMLRASKAQCVNSVMISQYHTIALYVVQNTFLHQ